MAGAIEVAAHEAILQAADINETHVRIDGVLHRKVLRSIGTYYTLAGPVQLERSLYRPTGQRNAPTVDPVALRVGALDQRWLPATAAAMAFSVQLGPSREAEAQARHQHRLPYSRSAFEDVTHLVGRQVREHRSDNEDVLVESLVIPENACSVSASMCSRSQFVTESRSGFVMESD